MVVRWERRRRRRGRRRGRKRRGEERWKEKMDNEREQRKTRDWDLNAGCCEGGKKNEKNLFFFSSLGLG